MSEIPAREPAAPAPRAADASERLTSPPGPVPTAPRASPRTPKLWSTQTAISIFVTVGILVALALSIDIEAVWLQIRQCDKGLALAGLLCHYATYQIRGVRWRRTLRHLHGTASSWRFGLLVFFYNFVDNVVPAKLGDVYGAHLARINLGVTRGAALGSIVFLRMIDAWVVLVVAALGSSFVFADALPDAVVWALILGGVIAAAATIIVLTFTLLKERTPSRLPEAIRKRVEAFQAGMWPRRRELATIAGLTILIWALETAWILCLAMAFGIQPGIFELLFLTMIPLLASAFPLTPSGAGVVELSLYGSLRALDVSGTVAASLTVLNRIIDYWLHIVLGILVWALRVRLGLRTWREVPIEMIGVGANEPALTAPEPIPPPPPTSLHHGPDRHRPTS